MTEQEKPPLHVQVASVIGWTSLHPRGRPGCCGDILLPGIRWAGRAPGNVIVGPEGIHDPVPPYGEDSPEGWACTGPLAELYVWGVHRLDGQTWLALPRGPNTGQKGVGPTPLIAICNLILKLSESGALPRSG